MDIAVVSIITVLWCLSLVLVYNIASYKAKKRLLDLKTTAKQLKLIVESSIKDKIISDKESVVIRESILDIEEKLDH